MWDEWGSPEINSGLNYFNPIGGLKQNLWTIYISHLLSLIHDNLRPQLNPPKNNFIRCGFPGFTQDDGEKLVWE